LESGTTPMRTRGAGFLPFRHELVLDWFAGGGGASTGIEAAIGRPVDLAVNHDGAALAMHEANHPGARHVCSDVFEVDPLEVTRGQPVGLAWFSPDCTFFSKARGAKPFREPNAAARRRGLAWVVVKVAAIVKPRVIMLENVEEFAGWGPLGDDGLPCPIRKGLTFRRWKRELERLGYRVEARELRAHHYGAPTIRKRLFVIARRDGLPIVWPEATHGPGLEPYRTAAECIDWTLPCPSIFLTKEQGRALGVKRPLADATMRRIARGMWKFVINNPRPFVVSNMTNNVPRGADEPLTTILTGNHKLLLAPVLANTRNGERKGQAPRVRSLLDPAPTVTAEGSQGALVAAFLAKHYGGKETPGAALVAPLDTVTARDHHALVTSHLLKLRNHGDGADMREPLDTLTSGGNHFGEVRAFLLQYNGGDGRTQDARAPINTITADPRFGLVTVAGVDYAIVDIGMRMLSPRELFSAQGFPRDYVIDPVFRGGTLTKEQQIGLVGNSVSPPVAAALVRANFAHEAAYEAVAS
jgi:DNA (cytosine-5)-methyltransferase 1